MGGGAWLAPICLRESVQGEPLDVTPPTVGATICPRRRGFDEDENYNNWVKTRLREVWPLELSA